MTEPLGEWAMDFDGDDCQRELLVRETYTAAEIAEAADDKAYWERRLMSGLDEEQWRAYEMLVAFGMAPGEIP